MAVPPDTDVYLEAVETAENKDEKKLLHEESKKLHVNKWRN